MGSSPSSVDCTLFDKFNITEEIANDYFPIIEKARSTFSAFLSFSFAIGVFSNMTFLFVLFRNPNLRSETDVYVTHLSLADLLYMAMPAVRLLPTPSKVHVNFQSLPTSSAQCLAFGLLLQASFYASIALVTMVSFERYLALCHPIKHLRMRGKRRTYKLVASCWLFGLLWGTVLVPSYSKYLVTCFNWPDSDKYQDYPYYSSYCTSDQSLLVITIPLRVIPWSISMLSTVYMYARIILKLHKRRGPAGSTTSKDQNAQRIRNQVAKMLMVNGMVFFLCQAPLVAVDLIILMSLLSQTYNTTIAYYGFYIGSMPQLINVFINPFIYGAMNSQYRAAFLRAFHCTCSPRMPPSSSTVRSTHIPPAPKPRANPDSNETMESYL